MFQTISYTILHFCAKQHIISVDFFWGGKWICAKRPADLHRITAMVMHLLFLCKCPPVRAGTPPAYAQRTVDDFSAISEILPDPHHTIAVLHMHRLPA